MKLTDYLITQINEDIFDVAINKQGEAEQIAVFSGSKDSGAKVGGIKFQGNTTGKKIEKVPGNIVLFLTQAATQEVIKIINSRLKQPLDETAVQDFLAPIFAKYGGLPFTNNAIELEVIPPSTVRFTGQIAKLL